MRAQATVTAQANATPAGQTPAGLGCLAAALAASRLTEEGVGGRRWVMAERSEAKPQSLEALQTELHQLPARVAHSRAEMQQTLNWSKHLLTTVQEELLKLPVPESAAHREREHLTQSIAEIQQMLARQAADGQQFEAQLQRLIADLHTHFGHVAE